MEQASFKSLFWNINESVAKLTTSIESDILLWDRTCYWNMFDNDIYNKCVNLVQNKNRFYLTVELILAFESSPNMVREVKNLSPIFKHI